MAALTLSQSGGGKSDFTLDQVRELAADLGFVKPDVPYNAPTVKRVDMDKFFKAYGANSLSAFKKSFADEKLPQPGTAEFELYVTQKTAAKAAAAKGKKGGMNADGELVRCLCTSALRPCSQSPACRRSSKHGGRGRVVSDLGRFAGHCGPASLSLYSNLCTCAGSRANGAHQVRADSYIALRGALRQLGGALTRATCI